jgi:hypothetical protein
MKRLIVLIVLIFVIAGCGSPPSQFAPDKEIISQALLLTLEQAQSQIAQQLNTEQPKLLIENIKVKETIPSYLDNLAVYHLVGSYDLRLQLPHRKVKQKNNPFDLFLQRQAEGKSWRLLKKNAQENQWSSYLITLTEKSQ